MSTSMLKPLILHAHSTGPNPYKVAIALEALNIPYHVKVWEFGDAANGVKGPEFLKINPNGRVPALEDPNTSITAWESGAIISYLLRQYDVSHRFSPSPSWTAQQSVDFDTWIAFLLSTLGPMTGQTNWYRHYNAVKNDDALKRFGEQTRRCYGVVEGQLRAAEGGKGGILGQGINAVDWHFYPWVKQHEYAGLSIDEFPLLKKWKLAMEEREEVKRAYGKVEAGENVSA